MKRQTLTLAILAVLALACGAAFAGYPLTHFLPAEMLAALGAMGGMPFMIGEVKTLAEQISAFEAKRASLVAKQTEIQTKAIEEGRSKDEAEKEEFKGLTDQIKAIDEELADLRVLEAQAVKAATPINKAVATNPDAASAARGGSAVDVANGVVRVATNLPKGIAYVRYVKSMIAGGGNPMLALMFAQNQKAWAEQSPQVVEFLKTAVAGGTTTAAGWAAEWVYNQNLESEFIDILRPMTVLGKLTNLTKVPFNVRVSGMDSGSTASWVGQGKAIPVSKGHSIEVNLGMAKVAGLVVLSEELVRSSSPSAEMKMRDDMTKAIVEFTDRRFLDPNFAEVANVSPASITNGVTPVAPTGTALANFRADIQTLFQTFIANNDDPTTATWILDHTMALTISMMQNALGQNEFPKMGINGGEFAGLPAVVSNCANITGSPDSGHMIILAKQSDIMLADDGSVEIDASREASVEMTDAPAGDASAGTAGTTSLVSMFQTKSVALRAVRPINWKKSRSTAVAYIKEAAYVA